MAKKENIDSNQEAVFHITMSKELRRKLHIKAKILSLNVIDYARRVLEVNTQDVANLKFEKTKILNKGDII